MSFLASCRTSFGEPALILTVDDSASVRQLLAAVLTSAGHRVSGAVNGAAGLDAARQQLPDLILSDFNMPELDGLGLLAQVRKDPLLRSTPVVLISSEVCARKRGEAAALGAAGWLEKPLQLGPLLRAVELALSAGHAPTPLTSRGGRL